MAQGQVRSVVADRPVGPGRDDRGPEVGEFGEGHGSLAQDVQDRHQDAQASLCQAKGSGMTKRAKTAKSTGGSRQPIRFERTYQAPIKDVWDLWTTKEGIESWWGPEGFATAVRKLDLRPGGGFEYAMTATDPAQIEGLKALGVALTSVARGTYTEVVP